MHAGVIFHAADDGTLGFSPRRRFLTSARVAGATRVAHGGRSLSVHPENPRLLVNSVGNNLHAAGPPWVLQISGV